jgi:hypothetical protein
VGILAGATARMKVKKQVSVKQVKKQMKTAGAGESQDLEEGEVGRKKETKTYGEDRWQNVNMVRQFLSLKHPVAQG